MVEADFGVSSQVEEVTEPRLLAENEVVRFVVKKDTATIFHFDIDKACKITLDSWELDGESTTNTNMFVTVNDENVSKDNYKWKSTYGVDKVDIYPDRADFKHGTYRVAVQLPEDSHAERCARAIRLRTATRDEAVSLNNLDAPYQATVTEKPLYFTYDL